MGSTSPGGAGAPVGIRGTRWRHLALPSRTFQQWCSLLAEAVWRRAALAHPCRRWQRATHKLSGLQTGGRCLAGTSRAGALAQWVRIATLLTWRGPPLHRTPLLGLVQPQPHPTRRPCFAATSRAGTARGAPLAPSPTVPASCVVAVAATSQRSTHLQPARHQLWFHLCRLPCCGKGRSQSTWRSNGPRNRSCRPRCTGCLPC